MTSYRMTISQICLTILFYFVSTPVFAQNKQALTLDGLRAPVEVLRDEWGVNHIYAANQHDLFFAQGYCAVKDRPFQFEVWRRQATGTVAQLLGPQELKRDIGTRLFKFRGDLDKELSHYHPDGISIIEAYVAGVNAYIDELNSNPRLLPSEFKILGITPQKWTPEIVISRHQGLLGNINEELNTGIAVAKAGQDKVKELMWFHPKDPDLNIDPAIDSKLLSKEILELYDAYHRPLVFKEENTTSTASVQQAAPLEHGLEGSNNWIISGNKTASGFPYLANDPHRSIKSPSLRYMVHLVAPGWNVIGGGEPVIPGVSIGHNEKGAWGLTIFETDGEDLYVYDLNPQKLHQYKHRGKWVDMQELNDTIPVKGSKAMAVVLRYTLHGPVTYIDSVNHKAYAVKCAWLEPGGAPYLASLRINQAKTWKDFRDAARYSHIPGENMIWADKKGNIGWQVVGITPIRKNFSGMVPIPGDGRYEWDGYLDIKKRPHLLNPKKGFFATANQHVTPDNYQHWNTIGYTWADPFRGNRINEVLNQSGIHSIEHTKALQSDYLSIPARTLVPMLQKLTLSNELSEQAKAHLMNWDYRLEKNSVAAGIYAMWERKLSAEANSRFMPPEIKGLFTIQLKKLMGWLNTPDEKFGKDVTNGRDAFLAITFEKAIQELNAKYGGTVESWTYGQREFKHISLSHPLAARLTTAQKEKYTLGPLPRGGNSHTPNSTGGNDNQSSGASFRLITDTQDWDKTLMINTPGQSEDPASKYYSNLFEFWANDEYFPAYFSKDKILKHTDLSTTLNPPSN
ncbi:penicillin acylase family protein [Pedobacter immunditicola]|uniref:penicillin acylase family protein n=1 Tax=Pedobacter immunditicola TaxID=3133440 RepID=UPI0030A68D5E